MQQLEKLFNRIIQRVNMNLRRFDFDAAAYLDKYVPLPQLTRFYAFYGITGHHPLHLHFSRSNLAGSYFLGKCKVENSILYKSDIRGDELKNAGDVFDYRGAGVVLDNDEVIWIQDSHLIKTLVHNCSHDPENPEIFKIHNTAAASYANIHGSPMDGCFLGPFSTVDLTSVHGCIIGTFSYVRAGELWHQRIGNGIVWVNDGDRFDFFYQFPEDVLEKYIRWRPGSTPQGVFMDFVETRKEDFRTVFDVVHLKPPKSVPASASLSRYAVIKPKTRIGENVLVAQRAYLEDTSLGKGSNAQENCYVLHSQLAGNNVIAHGAKLNHAHLKPDVFVGFNSFLHGTRDCPLTIDRESIIMPHTVVDLAEPLTIPSRHLVWGCIRTVADLRTHSISLDSLAEISGPLQLGAMHFKGDGAAFVSAFRNRIRHILEANGAYYHNDKNRGHAQKGQSISFNIIQPYPMGVWKGVYPTIDIQP
jgi:carbonic anhydrase/acetyltransferase-like protein (isoleucine patch superfamily)